MSEETAANPYTSEENKPAKVHTEVEIPEEVEELLEDLPEPQQKAVRAVLVGFSYQAMMWRGPLPPPEELKKYNDAFENGAEKIFLEAKSQREHRHALENKVIPEELAQSRQGQLFGFVIALFFLGASTYLIASDKEVAGTILGTVDLVALVTVFIMGRLRQRKKLDE